MALQLRLRPVTASDADLLLEWRNDVGTRIASQQTLKVEKADHLRWLTNSLQNEDRTLMIVEENGVPVGTVRADLSNGVYKLSWTVAPHARGRGVGKAMVALFVAQLPGEVCADVKKENHASARIAEFAGMQLDREENGILRYKRSDGEASGPMASQISDRRR